MTSHDLLERQAERGTQRGSAIVWANARPEGNDRKNISHMWFRVALAVLVVAMSAVGLLQLVGGGNLTTAEEPDTEVQDLEETALDSDLPLPIFVEGAELTGALAPCQADPTLECDEPMEVDFGLTETEFARGVTILRTVIFADPENPFDGPVVGIETLDDGLRTWTLNADQAEEANLAEQIVFVDGSWQLPEASGLEEVHRFDGSPQVGPQWQLEFSDGFFLQPEPVVVEQNQSIWLWVVPLVRDNGGFRTNISSVDVLGFEGVHLTDPESGRIQETIWAHDQFVYRFSGSPAEDAGPAPEDRLMLVDPEVWEIAVADALFSEDEETFLLIRFVILLLVGTGAAICLIKVARRLSH